ncbi:XAC2610-related protein [Hymenobacter montanus]|nr:hypothetical protein [Hymenobacter montanus]
MMIFLCISVPGIVRAQAAFSGLVGTAPIELVLGYYEPESEAGGVYAYTKYHTPIALSGTLKAGVLTLTEKDALGKPSATLTVPAFAVNHGALTGTWKNLATGRELPLKLNQRFIMESGESVSWEKRELMQASSLPTIYFRLVTTKSAADTYPRVRGVKLLDKKTDRLLQEFSVNCQLLGLNNVDVDDYNFDGLADFSVYEAGSAGPNTTSLYFLYNPTTKRYAKSSFSGTSLEFDHKKKHIYERSSSAAGSYVTTATYEVVRNRMVLVAKHCYVLDPERHKLVERKLSACE